MANADDITVWADASILALGAIFEKREQPVEDMSWLRKMTDVMHINVTELEPVAKGINMAVKWGGKCITIKSDSRSMVVGWVKVMLSQAESEDDWHCRIVSKKEERRVATMRQLIDELGMVLSIELVPTEKNKADELTRVPMKWLDWVKREKRVGGTPGHVGNVNDIVRASRKAEMKRVHELCHFGVERTQIFSTKEWN